MQAVLDDSAVGLRNSHLGGARAIISERISSGRWPADLAATSRIGIADFLSGVPNHADYVSGLFSGLSASEFLSLNVNLGSLLHVFKQGEIPTRNAAEYLNSLSEKDFSFLLINTIKGPDNFLHARVMGELSRSPQIDTLHAMTFNIWGIPRFIGGRDFWRFPKIAELVSRTPVDIVCLQEVFHPKARHCIREMASKEGFYISTTEEGGIFGIIGSNGLHTISRLPAQSCEFVPFQSAIGFQRFVKKGFLHTVHTSKTGEKVHVYNLHLQSTIRKTPLDRVSKVRAEQLQQLSEHARRNVNPNEMVMFLGDFNISDDGPENRAIDSLLATDSWSTSNTPDTGASFAGTSYRGATYDPLANPYAASMRISNIRTVPERIDRVVLIDPRASSTAVMMTTGEIGGGDMPALSDHESVSLLRAVF